MTAYNVEAAHLDFVITEGDTPNWTFSVTLNDVAYDMTGKTINMHVRDKWDNLIASYSTASEITIATSSLNISSAVTYTKPNRYRHDIQVTDGAEILTMAKGLLVVQKEETI
jgi:hypothetical protein